MEIITGHTGASHIYAADDRAFNAFVYGDGNYVLDSGKLLKAEAVNVNKVRIYDGELIMQGTKARIRYGEYQDLAIDNGATGYNRNDLIIAEYTNSSGVESIDLKVLKGTATTGTAADPTVTAGDILAGDLSAQMSLFRVRITGINIAGIDTLYQKIIGGNMLDQSTIDLYNTITGESL